MFRSLDFFIAYRYLRAKRKEGFISIIAWFSFIGVMLGVATLIVVLSVMNGFRSDLLTRIIGINGHVNIVSSHGTPFRNDDKLVPLLNQHQDVIAAMPVIEAQGLATHNGLAKGLIIRGYRPDDFMQRPILAQSVFSHQASQAFQHHQGALAGYRLARELRLDDDNPLKLLSPNLQSTVFGSVPKSMNIRIIGAFNLGMYEYDQNYLFMNLQDAQRFLNLPNHIHRIEVIGNNPDKAESLARELQALLPPEFRAIAWQQVNGSFFTALQVERNVMFIILTLIILVAAFNIISSQIMLVKDKAMGIAILRSMGATRAMIYRIFLITGSAVGLMGTLSGMLLGILLASNIDKVRHLLEGLTGVEMFAAEIYFLSNLPSKIDWMEVGIIALIAVGLSLLASLYPAWRAATIEPVEIFRYG